MAETKYIVFQNQTGQTIFLLIKAKENGPVMFEVYSKAPKSIPDGAMLAELENETAARIENKNYTDYRIYNKSGKQLSVAQEDAGETINLILESDLN